MGKKLRDECRSVPDLGMETPKNKGRGVGAFGQYPPLSLDIGFGVLLTLLSMPGAEAKESKSAL